MRDFIQKEVDRLVKKHKTNNPFEIASGENILVLVEPLGSINGYYNKFVRQKMIHINSDLSYTKQLFTCGHELGHSVLHTNANTPFLRDNTFYSINKLEREANIFVSTLLIPKYIINTYEGYTLEEIALREYIPIELLKLRFNVFWNYILQIYKGVILCNTILPIGRKIKVFNL